MVIYRVLFLLFASSVTWASAASAQLVMVDLGAQSTLFKAGLEIELPATINVFGDDGPVSIAMEVAYPADVLSFVAAKAGSSIEGAKGQLKADDRPGEGTQHVLRVGIEAPQPLATGTLASFKFRVNKPAKLPVELPIRNLDRSAKTASGQALTVKGVDGTINILEPIPACFFYMH